MLQRGAIISRPTTPSPTLPQFKAPRPRSYSSAARCNPLNRSLRSRWGMLRGQGRRVAGEGLLVPALARECARQISFRRSCSTMNALSDVRSTIALGAPDLVDGVVDELDGVELVEGD